MQHVVSFGGEADRERPVRTQCGHLRQNVGIAHQLQRQRVMGFLDFLLRRAGGAIIGDGGGGDENVRSLGSRHDRLVHFDRTIHVDSFDTGWGLEIDRTADQDHPRARHRRRPGHGEAHFPAAVVADEAHRIERLAGRAGGNQHGQSLQVMKRERRGRRIRDGRFRVDFGHALPSTEQFDDVTTQFHRLQHPPSADFATSLFADSRPPDVYAAPRQQPTVVLGRDVLPHQPIHRRRHRNRLVGGQTQRAEQIVGHAVG